MSRLVFHLLGSPQLERDGIPLRIVRRRALAVAIYLAATDRPHSRDQLMATFWTELSPGAARADLRRTLHVLRRSLGEDWLVADADQVWFDGHGQFWLDVAEFHRLLSACSQHGHPTDEICDDCLPLLTRAADLYRDDFLAGFSLPDSPNFDAWHFFERERLRAEMANMLARLIQGHVARRNHAKAIRAAHRWLILDPLDEESHRRLMTLYAESGQLALARRQYEQCVRLLQQELDTPPSTQTDALFRTLQARPVPTVVEGVQVPTDGADGLCHPLTEAPSLDEIRLITAVSIGLVERTYDSLAPALDERMEDAQTLLSIVSAAAAPFDGQVSSIVGEDLLIFFGANRVREDDAERGVRAGLAAASLARKHGLAIQIGVNSGMAYIRRSTEDDSVDFSVMGSVVNLAIRLRNRAGTGEVLVGAGTYRPTLGVFVYESLSMTLPGVEGPIPAYRTLQPRRHPTKVRGIDGLRAEMIGRQDEMTILQTMLDHVRSQGRGWLAAIVAPAGVGKSRLVAELKRQPEAEAFLWLEGRSQPLTVSTGYWIFTDMLHDYLSRDAGEGALAQALLGLLHRLRQRGFLSEVDEDELGLLLGQLLSLRFESAKVDWLDNVVAQQLRRRTLFALKRFFHALAEEQPLVLICEDLHWADPLSLDLIGALMETLTSLPLLLLAIYRPEESQADGQLSALARRRCPDSFTELKLQALDDEESHRLVASLLAIDALPASMHNLIADKAEGNPLYLEEVVRTLIDSDVLYQEGPRWRTRRSLASVVVPATLQSIVLSRVDRLERKEIVYLQAAAVLGRLFRPRLVEAMTDGGLRQETTLVRLVQESLIHAERSRPEPEYSFHHVLVRDAIYQDLPRGYRVDLHRRAALAIERLYGDNLQPQIELLAYHYALSDDTDKAVYYQVLAGRKAQAAYLNDEAHAYLEQALELLATLEPSVARQKQRVEALHGLGEISEMLGNIEEAETSLSQALALATDLALPPLQRASICLSLCQLRAAIGDNAGLIELYDQGSRLIADCDAPVEKVAFTAYLARALATRGDWHGAMSHVASIVEIIADLPYSERLTYAYFYAVFWSRYAKQVVWGFKLIDGAIADALRRRDFWSVSQLQGLSRMFLCETIGDADGLLTCVTESNRFAELAGDELSIRSRNYWLSVYYGWLVGNLDEAERCAQFDLLRHDSTLHPSSYLFSLAVLGIVYYCRHDWQAALKTLERVCQLATSDQFRVDGVRRSIVGLAWTYQQLGRSTEGLTLLAKIAQEEELHIESWPTVACALAGLQPMCDDVDVYDALCREIVATREDEPLPLIHWRLHPAARDRLLDENGAMFKPDFSGWTWHDQFNDCSYSMEQDKLVICAANYHDLWLNNFSAPHLLRSVRGNFAIETVCSVAAHDRPALGGLLLWLDQENYVRLTWNTLSPRGIDLLGCLDNVNGLYGIGQLSDFDRVRLRLERVDNRVQGLCSGDGLTWYSVGIVNFPVSDPVETGPLAIGMIHRYVHAGAWPGGTAIRFESIHLFSME